MKDTSNLLSYNQWTCGDYNGINEFFNQAQLTNKYSNTGEYCIQAKRTSSSWWSDTQLSLSNTGQYTLSCKILNKTGDVAVLRLLQDNASVTVAQVSIPVTDSFTSFSLTGTFTNLNDCRICLLNYGSDDLFIDNIELTTG